MKSGSPVRITSDIGTSAASGKLSQPAITEASYPRWASSSTLAPSALRTPIAPARASAAFTPSVRIESSTSCGVTASASSSATRWSRRARSADLAALGRGHRSGSVEMLRRSCSRSPRSMRDEHALDEVADRHRVERLDDVADAAELLAEPPVGRVGTRGQEDDRNLARLLVGRQLAGDRPAVELRHHHVEQDEIGPLLARELEALAAVGGLEHLDARSDQVDAAKQPDRALVVDDQHPPRGAGRGLRVTPAGGLGIRAAPPLPAWLSPQTPPPDGDPPSAERSRANRMGDLGSHSRARIVCRGRSAEQSRDYNRSA